MAEPAAVVVPQKRAFVEQQLGVQQLMALDFHSNYWAAIVLGLDSLQMLVSNSQADLLPADDVLAVESVDLNHEKWKILSYSGGFGIFNLN